MKGFWIFDLRFLILRLACLVAGIDGQRGIKNQKSKI